MCYENVLRMIFEHFSEKNNDFEHFRENNKDFCEIVLQKWNSLPQQMLPSFVIGTIAKISVQLIRTTTNSIKKVPKRHKRHYFTKSASPGRCRKNAPQRATRSKK